MASGYKTRVLIVGRLSGPKNEVILRILREVIPSVALKVPDIKVHVVGGPLGEEHLELARKFAWLKFEGFKRDPAPYYQKADVVVGAGRVALEAMALKRPVIAVGERLYIGPLDEKNRAAATASNFGDCAEKEAFDWVRMARDLERLLTEPRARERTAREGFRLLRSEYDMRAVSAAMGSLYGGVLLERNLRGFHEVPVLMYHRVVETPAAGSKYNLHVTRDAMEKQLLFLRARSFETVTFEDLTEKRVPARPVILTFDDGYEDNYLHLFPLLKKHGMKAVIFLLGDRKRRTNFWDVPHGEPEAPLLSPAQVREMANSGLVEFGAHSMSHVNLTETTRAAVEREVAGSKAALERFLGKKVVSFAYPYGFVNEEIKEITARAGYTFGVSVGTGPTRFGEDLLEIRRVHMFPGTSLFDYWKKTSGYYLRYRKWMRRPEFRTTREK